MSFEKSKRQLFTEDVLNDADLVPKVSDDKKAILELEISNLIKFLEFPIELKSFKPNEVYFTDSTRFVFFKLPTLSGSRQVCIYQSTPNALPAIVKYVRYLIRSVSKPLKVNY